jgi:hypothetical protein
MSMRTINSRDFGYLTPKLNGSARGADAVVTAANRVTGKTIMRWRVSRQYWIRDALQHPIRTRPTLASVESINAESFGFRRWSADVEIDVRSPITERGFHAMPLAEQVDYLRTWTPENPNWDGPTLEGLAATLQAAVKVHPLLYIESASEFAGLDPLYASALVRGLSEGLEGKTVSNWKPFWTFADWILAQPDPEIGVRDGFSGETRLGRRWQNCRLEIVRFLDATLNGELAALPLSERASLWPVIELLTRDPSPATADEAAGDKCSMDPFTLSLNTVRGEALHAVCSFVHWIRSNSPEAATGGENLDDVPEARAALETHLDPRLEPSLTIRSVFGANLLRLAHWAEAWLRCHLEQILPAHGHDELRQIAWETYVRFSCANSKVLALFHQEYSAAITRMSQDGLPERRSKDALVSLGQHLVVNYCRRSLDFEQPGDLLAAFFARAPESVRAAVLAFVARSLAQPAEPISPDFVERLLKLWNWQAQRETTAVGAGSQDEAA